MVGYIDIGLVSGEREEWYILYTVYHGYKIPVLEFCLFTWKGIYDLIHQENSTGKDLKKDSSHKKYEHWNEYHQEISSTDSVF